MIDSAIEAVVRQFVVGDSRETCAIRRLIPRIAVTGLPVWIEGETGVGKEQVAQAIHALSGRRGAFVAVNVCAIADTMFEDAFFGHARGAFTGARDETSGYFAEANDGTLFLDEISSLPTQAQVKLLRAVETHRYRQVGGRSDRTSRVRIITASNEPAEALVRRGDLRLDLAFRLRGWVVQIPPLGSRRGDIPALAEHFLAMEPVPGPASLAVEAQTWLLGADWRGNVRELRQVLTCARALATGEEIGLQDLQAAHRMIAIEPVPARAHSDESTAERLALLQLLDAHRWDTVRVAEELAVDRTTVYRRMRRLSIQTPILDRSSRR